MISQGDWDSFEVTYLDTTNRRLLNSTRSPSITIGNLRPFRNYTFTIITVAGVEGRESTVRRRV